ncbi:efflux RND transporter permease subunit [Fulvivirga maritima]|uniref:efflux RND transporter permease subunit n=1 Tax=Fulvivirga maritima TaxID=2904247 RepID=UPI001F383C67|nr:efflux RND transporter permease subunit [Fulvivirga maritima]UII27349.1 efflux RND transporter permease subunit [Fulvivirga maritima]
MLNRIIKYFLENKLVTFLLLLALIAWGIVTAPFGWDIGLPRDPVPVDAIPDLGENQQIVYTEWKGRSPQDIEDQITYPLTTALLGIPGVKTIRSNSVFGFSSIYIIFDEDLEFYWSRTRILEKLNSLPAGTLPSEATPALGPDATALGQIYWYTLEGRNPETGKPNGGWDPQELRTLQDFYVKYGLTSASGVAEVASVGGYVKEYQVDIDPDAMKASKVSVAQIMQAVKKSNLDIGARTIEFNKAEYLVRGLGYIKNLDDLKKSVVTVRDNVPIRIEDVAHVSFGPAPRRGGLDKGGAEAVGGVVVARYGANPMEVITNVKEKIDELSSGLPQKTLEDGSISKVTIVPFYDRSGLIHETLGTLESALSHEILISILVVIVLVMNLRASILISSLLPIGVLITFISMRYFGVDANVVALSGIAIAIGVMVDVGIVFVENIVRHLELPENNGVKGKQLQKVVFEGAKEVAPAIMTALATTVVSFIPVFAMEAAEGKLFRPLAFTKTFAILSSFALGIIVIPTLAQLVFSIRLDKSKTRKIWGAILIVAGVVLAFIFSTWIALLLSLFGVISLTHDFWEKRNSKLPNWINIGVSVLIVLFFLTQEWMPLGPQNSAFANFLFVVVMVGSILAVLLSVVHFYPRILPWCLNHKLTFLIVPVMSILLGVLIWQGFNQVFGFVATGAEKVGWELRDSGGWQAMEHTFPGVGKEFMPTLDEGSFLLMPSTMPHTGVEQNIEVIRQLDLRVNNIPEVESVVGKWGRTNSALDPAPVSMFENIINYKSEYILDEDGQRQRFKVNEEGAFELKNGDLYDPQKGDLLQLDTQSLIKDPGGEYFRQWRPEIQSPDDIWEQIVAQSDYPGLTSAPKLQPIQTRLVMLQTGMRAPMGIKVYGPDLKTIEKVGFEIEKVLKQVPSIDAPTVFADRVVGKPYLNIDIDREAIGRYGLTIQDVQSYISGTIGGMEQTSTVEGRERFAVRVRYAREFRDSPQAVKEVLIPTPSGAQIPLGQLATIKYTQGPQNVKSENTFLVSYVIFDMKEGFAEVDVVEQAQAAIQQKIDEGAVEIPAGVSYQFTGNYENQVRATQRLLIVVPLSLIIIFLILYFQFKSVTMSAMVFSGIFVAFSGGFLMVWLYGQDWFMNFSVAGTNLRDLFQMHTINLSVAVWVGFIALFGIATDDGVIMGTYLTQTFEREKPATKKEVRKAVLHAGMMRVRPAMMTAATAIIALLPVLSSTGKGSDIMVPMAIPAFGGMLLQVMTMFVVPVLYSVWQERRVKDE